MPEYARPDWAVGQTVRASGLVEDICEHGVGHPNREFLERHPGMEERGFGVHGCDGCCRRGRGRPEGADPDEAAKRRRDDSLRRVFGGEADG